MKAILVHEFGESNVLRLEEVPTPRPGPGQVLVRMHAIGINPVETYIRAGTYARLPALPYTPGNDGAGVIEQIGADVNEFKPGDRVYTGGSLSGTYAEFALCKTEQVHRLPENVSFPQGAAMGTPYATAYRGLFQRADAWRSSGVAVVWRSIRAIQCNGMSTCAEWYCRTPRRKRWRAFTPHSWPVWKTERCVR